MGRLREPSPPRRGSHEVHQEDRDEDEQDAVGDKIDGSDGRGGRERRLAVRQSQEVEGEVGRSGRQSEELGRVGVEQHDHPEAAARPLEDVRIRGQGGAALADARPGVDGDEIPPSRCRRRAPDRVRDAARRPYGRLDARFHGWSTDDRA